MCCLKINVGANTEAEKALQRELDSRDIAYDRKRTFKRSDNTAYTVDFFIKEDTVVKIEESDQYLENSELDMFFRNKGYMIKHYQIDTVISATNEVVDDIISTIGSELIDKSILENYVQLAKAVKIIEKGMRVHFGWGQLIERVIHKPYRTEIERILKEHVLE